MADNREIDINVKMTADKAAAAATAATLKKMDADIAGLRATIGDTGTTADKVSKKLADMSRNARVENLGTQYGNLARKIGDTDKATALLVKRLQEVGASSAEIDQATSAFARAQDAAQGGGGAGGGRSTLTKLGSTV